ncbi:MAG: hypothetical protein ABII88_01175 [Candidatus Omnitrophota bacterium]
MNIKGVHFKSMLSAVKILFGEEGFKKAVSGLTEEDKKIVNTERMASVRLLPLDSVVRFMEIVIRDLAAGDERIALKMGKIVGDLELNSIYRVFITTIGNPEFIVKKTPMIFEALHDSGKLTFEKSEENNFLMTVTGFSKNQRVYEFGMMGWIKYYFELSGVKSVKAEIIKSIGAGEKEAQYKFSWD